MSFIAKHLMLDEDIRYETKPHWIIFLLPMILFGVSAAIDIVHPAFRPVAFFIFAFAMINALMAWATYYFSEYAVTNKRVIAKTGVISRRTRGVLLSKIEAIDVRQPVLGRLFGYGTVIIRGTGGTQEVFYRIMNPFVFRHETQRVVSHGQVRA